LTVEAWVYLEELPRNGDRRRWIVNKTKHECTEGHYGLVISGDRPGAYLNFGDGNNQDGRYEAWGSGLRLKVHVWHHLAMTYDEADLKVYLDGEEVASLAINKPRRRGRGPLRIGRRVDGYTHHKGLIDEACIYSRALSPAEVKANRHAVEEARPGFPVARSQEGLIAQWGFDAYSQNGEAGVGWQWTDRPAGGGSRVHTHEPTPAYASHGVFLLGEPVTAHLPFDRVKAMAALKQHIPTLGGSEYAWRYFQALLDLDPAHALEHCRWFVKTLPGHPRTEEILVRLADAYRAARKTDPTSRVEKDAAEAAVSPDALFRFRRHDTNETRSFIRDWRILGNVTGAGVYVDPRATGAQFFSDARGGEAPAGTWMSYRSPAPYIDFAALFEQESGAIAYGACWVHVEKDQPAVLELGSDGACAVWLNRALLAKTDGQWGALPGDEMLSLELPRGWSELLLAAEPGRCGWAVSCALLDRSGRRPPGLKLRTEPPPGR
jgi:hypothetical protein